MTSNKSRVEDLRATVELADRVAANAWQTYQTALSEAEAPDDHRTTRYTPKEHLDAYEALAEVAADCLSKYRAALDESEIAVRAVDSALSDEEHTS